MRRLLALVAGAFLLVSAGQSHPLSPSEFRDRYAEAAAAATKGSTKVIDERTFRMEGGAADGTTVMIDGAYAAYLADTSQADGLIARYVRVILAAEDPSSASFDQLVVIVRPSDYLSSSGLSGDEDGNGLPARALAGDLSLFLAIDSPESISTAGKADLARWRVSEAEAWSYASQNVKSRIGSLQPQRLGDEAEPLGLGSENGLAPSILIDPALCSSASSGIGRQVVLVYDKNLLLLADSENQAQMERFWAAVKSGIDSGNTLSRTPLACQQGRWTVVPVPPK